MDRKPLFQAILWSVAAYLVFMFVVNRIWPPVPPPDRSPTTQPVETQAVPSTQPAWPETVAEPPAVPSSGPLTAAQTEEHQSFVLGSTDGGEHGSYRAQLVLTNLGAAIESVLLSDHKQVIDAEERYRLVGPVEIGPERWSSLAIEKVTVDKTEVLLEKTLWRGRQEAGPDGPQIVFECEVQQEQQPVLRLEQRYVLQPAPAQARRYDLRSELTVQNLSGEAHDVRITQRGPAGIRQEDTRDDRCVNVGVFLDGAVKPHTALAFAEVSKNTHRSLPLFGPQDAGRLWWVAAENKYFAFITTPVRSDGAEDPGTVYEASAVDVDGNADTHQDVAPRLVLGPLALPVGESTTLRMEHYIGPKDKRVFQDQRNVDYTRRNYQMLNHDRLTWCTFGWLTELMVTLLNAFYAVVRNYGVAIVLLVLVVRLVLHPVTRKTQVNMMKMQQSMSKLQPKLEEVKKRCANDKVRLQQETMRVYKEAGVNPVGQVMSCLPMLLQMPIWVALYTSLSNNIAMRHEGFVWWIRDLTAPDQLIKFGEGFGLPLVGQITAFNLLPILLGATMYIQQKLMPQPKPPAGPKSDATDQATQMQKQMQAMAPMMAVFFPLIMYNMPSGLNFYIMTSSILGSIEQYYIRKHVEAVKQKLAAAPVSFTDEQKPAAGPSPGSALLKPVALKWAEWLRKADQAHKLRRPRK